MSTQIYYFSGTGNSLSVAKKLTQAIEDSSLISIPQAIKNGKEISANTIGIVCPIYMYNLPNMVAQFISKIKSADYFFLVFAGAGQLGNGDKEAYKICEQNELKLSALFNIIMPDNYTPFGCPTKEEQIEILSKVDDQIETIIDTISSKKIYRAKTNTNFFKSNFFPALLYKLGHSRIKIMDQSFTVDDNCNGCGICQKVCPVSNVTLDEKKPTWHKNCEQCYACLQWCPTESIQYGKKTVGVKRYHHPQIKLKEIIKT